ncbi:helix-turn-helix transcriptional regulator [Streptomyces aureocirculatus]|uniref:helix-turn-helix transcriptional regulator n=1 Tax=Streptomyces aureocirculatus TaxID=67275 RepID=UPI00068E0B71|nr:helix-turn-helix transcriptional regulator [Streptomyces aureocirculatus]
MQDAAAQAVAPFPAATERATRLRMAAPARGGAPSDRRHVPHEPEELCEAGRALYARALRECGLHRESVADAPCLLDSGLLHPRADDPAWLLPTPPLVALPRLLAGIEARVARQRGRASRLASAFEPFLQLAPAAVPDTTASLVTVLKGTTRIRRAVRQALADASHEALGIHPGDPDRPQMLPHNEPWRMADFAERGGRLRTLSRPESAFDSLPGRAHPDRPVLSCEVRTLDELPPCLLVFDRTIAFIPAVDDGGIVFELRSPALVGYLATAFDIMWRLATPLYRDDTPRPPVHAVSQVQRVIARMLTEGHTDAEIAHRLDMNVRTVRLHVAKLAGLLGSSSRTQLGFLIGRSGILDRHV